MSGCITVAKKHKLVQYSTIRTLINYTINQTKWQRRQKIQKHSQQKKSLMHTSAIKKRL